MSFKRALSMTPKDRVSLYRIYNDLYNDTLYESLSLAMADLPGDTEYNSNH